MSRPSAAGQVTAVVAGLILLVAAVAAWWVSPWVTAILVGVAVVVLSCWQWYRRRRGIPPAPETAWTVYVWPLTFGALAVIALNGWIYRISVDAGGGSTTIGMLAGLATGVVGMAAAYGYGRVRAQKAQLAQVVDNAVDDPGEQRESGDDQQWFFPQAGS